MNERGSAIVAGHICLDIIPKFDPQKEFDFEFLFQPGSLTRVGPAILATGGPVSNTGLLLHRLGIPTTLLAKTGDDLFGQAIRQIVSQHGPGLDRGLIVDRTATTSYTVIVSPPNIDRLFFHCPGANDAFGAGDVPSEIFDRADLFHFGYPPVMKRLYQNKGQELVEIFRRAKESGITTSLDLCMPDPTSESGQIDWTEILTGTLPHVDIFMPSLDEILFMLEHEWYEQRRPHEDIQELFLNKPEQLFNLGRRILDMGVKILLIKLGQRGAYLLTTDNRRITKLGRARPSYLERWSNRELWVPCFKVNVVGTTGAGDATIAGFLNGLLRGFTPEDALISAVAVGACNVEASDALSGVPEWEKVQERVLAGWDRLIFCQELEGWNWSELGLWKSYDDAMNDSWRLE
jgi:sugar/nucleoside kinase (ribokinase family)